MMKKDAQVMYKCSTWNHVNQMPFYVCLCDVESHERLLKRNTLLPVWLSKSDEFDHRFGPSI